MKNVDTDILDKGIKELPEKEDATTPYKTANSRQIIVNPSASKA